VTLPSSWQLVLDYLRSEPIVYAKAITTRFGWSAAKARQVLSRMCRANYIERIQSKRSGVYRLVTAERRRSGVPFDDPVPNLGYHEGSFGFWYVHVPSFWVRRLSAPVVNLRTGMKQIGWKVNNDPCSAQLERNGTVRVYPHASQDAWRHWLQREVIRYGWPPDQAKLFNDKLTHTLRNVEFVGPQLPEQEATILPRVVSVPAMGVTLSVDDTPKPRTLELKIDVQGLERFLQINQIRSTVEELRNEIWSVLGKFGQQIESHLALIKSYREESLGQRIFLEQASQFFNLVMDWLEAQKDREKSLDLGNANTNSHGQAE